ncbi:MAG: glutathione peroxidase [Crocinitomix sp.]|nr:glutathione peroxidase [Crocinitomix sp.]
MSLTAFSQTSIHDFKFNSIDGVEQSFSTFKGKKILIVNTASECGFTPQYQDLQALHGLYTDKLVIIGFPANNFGAQEPGENNAIKTFCQVNYGVTFLMAEKVSVAGDDINPIFKWLCSQTGADFDGAIQWNFEKFLLDEKGKLINRFRSAVKPNSEKITSLL